MSEKDKPVRTANQRGSARLGAVQALYQMDVGGTPLTEVLQEFELYRLGKEVDEVLYLPADFTYFKDLVSGVVKQQRTLDPMIHSALQKGWPLARIDQTMRAIMRCGLYELMRHKEVPVPVILTEYVDVAKAFFEGDEPRVVNGVLDSLARGMRADEMKQKDASDS
ncbi:transcription antitermination factor NusB [Cohaesibacter celericrescens]|uniref:Transcription antitermination protein NusB n=1 Tax=Cohaesibacter celericrescens TaxID=2067669 RepID=A0A2N5XQE8_9HYPH|nr:transcription antitermination factor NusB [Cohaesibacter celericrescens]PLW76713.1 transcription antitermination factor NusB [Cohaesibacter celericrescens]